MSSWHGILIMRGLTGLALSGVAAVGMTYLSEEIHPSVIAFSMGLYISGNSIGGMSGRLLSGVITDFSSRRVAIAFIGCFALASALMFWKILPASRHFRPASLNPRSLMINFRLHWRDRGLPLLFAEGFLLMGAFVTLFNYIGYRLLSAPTVAKPGGGRPAVGGLPHRLTEFAEGRRDDRPLRSRPGAAVLDRGYADRPADYAVSVALADFPRHDAVHRRFFAAHSVASGWIGPRARRAKGQASSLYLFSYYVGSSVAGTRAACSGTVTAGRVLRLLLPCCC